MKDANERRVNNCANNVATMKSTFGVNHTTETEYSRICTDINTKVISHCTLMQFKLEMKYQSR